MSNLARRLQRAEKQICTERQENESGPLPPVVVHAPANLTGKDIERLGPIETWRTYQEQYQAQEKANAEFVKANRGCLGAVIKIRLDADKEYEARKLCRA